MEFTVNPFKEDNQLLNLPGSSYKNNTDQREAKTTREYHEVLEKEPEKKPDPDSYEEERKKSLKELFKKASSKIDKGKKETVINDLKDFIQEYIQGNDEDYEL